MAPKVTRTFYGGGGDGGGAGSSLVAVRRARNTGGDITAPNTSGAWQLVSGTGLTLPASVGDYVELAYTMMTSPQTSVYLDWVVVVSAAIARASSSDTATPLAEGSPGMYATVGTFRTMSGPFCFTAEAGDISGGNITFQLAVKAAGAGTIYKSATYPIILTARNYGPVDDG